VIRPDRKGELQKYITGIVTQRKQKLIAINCMPDHTHILLGLKADEAASDLIGRIKTGSSNHINKQRWIGCRFLWQEGFGAFSVSHSHLSAVINYIRNQRITIAANHFSRNIWNFWNAIRFRTTSVIFSSQLNDCAAAHVAPMELGS
jgi:putative transposase